MSGEIVFYHNPQSRGRTVHWMLEELGVPYRVVPISFEKREHKAPEFLQLNPMGKLPALTHAGTVITETAAIITYLADAFPDAGLAPPLGDTRRGTYLRWLFFGAGCLEPAVVDKMLHRPPVERESALGYGNFETTIHTVKKMLVPGPYILGDRFSAADVYLGAQLGWAMAVNVPGIKDEPVFTEYVGRITARPAYQRVMKASGG